MTKRTCLFKLQERKEVILNPHALERGLETAPSAGPAYPREDPLLQRLGENNTNMTLIRRTYNTYSPHIQHTDATYTTRIPYINHTNTGQMKRRNNAENTHTFTTRTLRISNANTPLTKNERKNRKKGIKANTKL